MNLMLLAELLVVLTSGALLGIKFYESEYDFQFYTTILIAFTWIVLALLG